MGLFSRKERPDRQASDQPVAPEVFYLNSGIGVALAQWNESIAAEHALKHPIVYRAINKIATHFQQVGWTVELDSEASPEDQAGKEGVISRLQCVLNDPNNQMTPPMLRYWMALNFCTTGEVPLNINHSAVRTSEVNGIYPLEARYTMVMLDERGVPKSYKYGQGSNAKQYPSRETWTPGQSSGFIDRIWRPSLNCFQLNNRNNTPLKSVGLPAQVITSLLRRAIQTAEGHPNVRYMVTCSRKLNEGQKSALRKYLNEDHGKDGIESGKVPILQNAADVEIHKLDNDLSDIHSKMPSDDMARLIFGAFDIPIALAGIGAADAAKFAGNFDGSRLAFWEDTIIPGYVSPIFQGLTKMICPPGVIISPNYDMIPAIQYGRSRMMEQVGKVTFMTTDEKRQKFGLGAAPEGFIESNQGNSPALGEDNV